mmetsp:Transcript_67680/g.195628  ORF Transcript_67680/g.195628 Transcript_67680/m.195628 type:complete len:802 (-) Transcript_67680:84-2489(-)
MANLVAKKAEVGTAPPATVARGLLGAGLPIQSRVAAVEAERPPAAVKVAMASRPSLGLGGLPIASRSAQAAAAGVALAGAPAAAPAPPAAPAKPALKGLPITSRVAVAAAEGGAPQQSNDVGKAAEKPQVATVAGCNCGSLSVKKRVNIEVDCPHMVTTPLVRRSARRRSKCALTATGTPTGSFHVKAVGSPTSLEGSLTPASHATTATSHSFVLRALSRTDTQSTNSSIKWAPQALIRSWHGKLTEVYKLVTIVGEGRSGAVFIVQHHKSEKYFACKVLRKGDHDAASLRSEIRTLRKLDHPNIVRLVETHEDSETVFLLMELCQGGDLFDKIVDEQTVSEPTTRLFARQMMSALSYCHSSGIIHRDIKPENFLLETEHPDCMTLKLADFGIATSVRPLHAAGVERTPASRDQRGGTAEVNFGSLPYTAPEILRGRGAVVASDMWSVGVTLYVMLSGKLPFDDHPDRICSGEAPDFSAEVWNHVSEEAIDLLRRLLKQDPAERLTAQQALAHEWFADCSPLPEVTPIGSSSSDEVDVSTDTACLSKLASIVLKSLRRWRKMPKLRRIAIAAVAKRLEAQHDAHRLAETVYTLFSDNSDVLRCDRLVMALSGSLGGPNATDSFGMAQTPSRLSLPGMLLSPTATANAAPAPAAAPSYRRSGSGSFTGLRVRERLKNSLRRFAGTPMHRAEVASPEAEASMAELRHLVGALDGMKSGIVDFTLLVACLLPAEVYADERHVAEAFALFDVQRRGRVSAGDVRAAVKSQDSDIRRFAAMLAQFDLNADGALDFEEFRAMVAGTN